MTTGRRAEQPGFCSIFGYLFFARRQVTFSFSCLISLVVHHYVFHIHACSSCRSFQPSCLIHLFGFSTQEENLACVRILLLEQNSSPVHSPLFSGIFIRSLSAHIEFREIRRPRKTEDLARYTRFARPPSPTPLCFTRFFFRVTKEPYLSLSRKQSTRMRKVTTRQKVIAVCFKLRVQTLEKRFQEVNLERLFSMIQQKLVQEHDQISGNPTLMV